MKDIVFSVVMSLVLFVTVSYVHRAKADPCGGANCTFEEPVTTLPQAEGGAQCTRVPTADPPCTK
jgi:hypothetical protein